MKRLKHSTVRSEHTLKDGTKVVTLDSFPIGIWESKEEAIITIHLNRNAGVITIFKHTRIPNTSDAHLVTKFTKFVSDIEDQWELKRPLVSYSDSSIRDMVLNKTSDDGKELISCV